MTIVAAAFRQDPKQLFRRLDALFGAIDGSRSKKRLLESFLDELFASFGDDLRILSGALYVERGASFVQQKRVNGETSAFRKELEPATPCLELLMQHLTYIYPRADDPASPAQVGVLPAGPASAILVGEPPRRAAFFFQFGDGWDHEWADFALNTIRAALGARMADQYIRGTMREAAQIQKSLLVDKPPSMPGYDIASRSVAAEEVGGDFYDFIPLDSEVLGVAVGDASGHGLPAALLVRDVVTGLRMGLERDLKMIPVFTKLNRVIHRSNLTSRFISVFYGELEVNGNLMYVNAGHPPPLLFAKDKVSELTLGGTVIGPMPEATFKRGFAHVDRGGILLMSTDGLVERTNGRGEQFGTERLKAAVRKAGDAPAQVVLERVFEACHAFGAGRSWEDDATAVVVRRNLKKPE